MPIIPHEENCLSVALAAALPAAAVTLNPDGLGQALIYPYYTAQSTGSDAFNTYLSLVNHTNDAQAARITFREGRLGKDVLDFNIFLSPNDVWTAALVPTTDGTRLITTDRSCTQPTIPATAGQPASVDFRNFAYAGPSDDGAGSGLDRTREAFIEIIEMGTLTGASTAAATHDSAGVPSNCAALDQLAQRSFYRAPGDPYVGFNAAEIDPVGEVDANGATYRSVWSIPSTR